MTLKARCLGVNRLTKEIPSKNPNIHLPKQMGQPNCQVISLAPTHTHTHTHTHPHAPKFHPNQQQQQQQLLSPVSVAPSAPSSWCFFRSQSTDQSAPSRGGQCEYLIAQASACVKGKPRHSGGLERPLIPLTPTLLLLLLLLLLQQDPPRQHYTIVHCT